MYIAVCDNEPSAAEALEQELLRLVPDCRTERFTSSSLFLASIQHGTCFDIVFMDIDWDQQENGMELAEKVAGYTPDAQVIFVTGYGELYSQQIFLQNTNLCGFLVKPVDPSILASLLQKAESRRRSFHQDKLLVQNKGVATAIPYSEILYFENEGRKTNVFFVNGNTVINERLEDIRKTFPLFFLNCHKSYTVNMNEIRRFEKNSIVLSNGAEIPVSRARYAEAREQYFRYIGQTMM